MNKKYAIELLEMTERKMLLANSSLFKEAYNYLTRIKSIQKDNDMMNRLYSAKFETRHK